LAADGELQARAAAVVIGQAAEGIEIGEDADS
jgi:hypothetical protein